MRVYAYRIYGRRRGVVFVCEITYIRRRRRRIIYDVVLYVVRIFA